MPDPIPWPTHGRAKEARDAAAENSRRGLLELDFIDELIASGDATRLDLSTSHGRIRRYLSDTFARMIDQGAPYRPLDEE